MSTADLREIGVGMLGHAEPTIAAAERGKHVLCEKPLGRTAAESHEIWQRVAATGVKHMCAFNYRFVPAVRLARQLVEAGEIGDVLHFRGRYLQEWGADPTLDAWRFQAEEAGGTLGDTGAHVIDLARLLAGEVASVSGVVRTFIPGRQVDDAIAAAVEFEGGGIGMIEATRVTLGHKNGLQWELNGTKGSIMFDVERLNELQVFRADGRARGFETVLVTEPDDPFLEWWWPPATSSAGSTRSCTRSIISSRQSPKTPRLPRSGRLSRTAIGPLKSATRLRARRKPGVDRTSSTAELGLDSYRVAAGKGPAARRGAGRRSLACARRPVRDDDSRRPGSRRRQDRASGRWR